MALGGSKILPQRGATEHSCEFFVAFAWHFALSGAERQENSKVPKPLNRHVCLEFSLPASRFKKSHLVKGTPEAPLGFS